LYLTNGEKFIGEFRDDIIDGKGKFFSNNGTTTEGTWDHNIFTNY